jgi:Holliday junction resolvase RusA-like endonuclease
VKKRIKLPRAPAPTVDYVELVVAGNPPLKNWKHRLVVQGGKPRRYNSPQYSAFVRAVRSAALQARAPRIDSGLWGITIVAWWGRKRHLDGVQSELTVGFGDIDAPIESVLDALQRAGVLDNDARVIELISRNEYMRDDPRVEIVLRRLWK